MPDLNQDATPVPPRELVIANLDGADKSLVARGPESSDVLADIGSPRGYDVHPASGLIVYVTRRGVFGVAGDTLWASEAGAPPRAIAAAKVEGSIWSPRIAPDGRTIAFGAGGRGERQLHVADVDGGNERVVVETLPATATYPSAWSPDGGLVYLGGQYDGIGEPAPLYRAHVADGSVDTAPIPAESYAFRVFSPDGTHVLHSTMGAWMTTFAASSTLQSNTVRSFDLASGDASEWLSSTTDYYYAPVWAPDGSRIAVHVSRLPDIEEAGVFTYDPRSGALDVRLTPEPLDGHREKGRQLRPVLWLPGERLVVVRDTSLATHSEAVLEVLEIESGQVTSIDTAHKIIVLGYIGATPRDHAVAAVPYASPVVPSGSNMDLNSAVRAGDVAAVRRIVGTIQNLDPVATLNMPLQIAAEEGFPEVIEVLLDHGADIDSSQFGNHWTPLITAAAHGQIEAARTLLGRGAHADGRFTRGRTPLHIAAAYGQTEMARVLIAEGADLNALTLDTDETPLAEAAGRGHAETARFLLEAGATFTLRDAAAIGDIARIEARLGAGDDVDAANGRGWTALHEAARHGHADAIARLVAAGASIEAATQGGETPLMLAARYGQLGAVTALVDLGADMNASSTAGTTVLAGARGRRHADVVAFLIQRGASMTLAEVVSMDDLAALTDRLADDPSVATVADARGRTPLHFAASAAAVRALLAAGAEVDARDRSGLTPLHAAAEGRGIVAVVEALIGGGADVNTKDDAGRTPIQLALEVFDQAIVDVLARHGARP